MKVSSRIADREKVIGASFLSADGRRSVILASAALLLSVGGFACSVDDELQPNDSATTQENSSGEISSGSDDGSSTASTSGSPSSDGTSGGEQSKEEESTGDSPSPSDSSDAITTTDGDTVSEDPGIEDGDEPSIRFDVGSGETGFEPPSQGCDKVDFLFVIDNSISMGNEQEALVRSFPGFMNAIKSILPEYGSYNIMVTDTDESGSCTEENCSKKPTEGFKRKCLEDGMDGYACQVEYTECDQTMGAGVVHPTGVDASNQLCDFPDGQRFLNGDDPNLDENFECAGLLGIAGHSAEKPMDAMMAALSEELNGPGGCNEGFLRDDAVLVVTFFSDDARYVDSGTPEEWREAVIAAKNGDEDAAVIIGVTPNLPDCRISKGNESGAHWREFVSLFGERGLQGTICDEDYSPLFTEAVNIVKDACDDFIPPG